MFRRQSLSVKGSRSRTQTDDIDSIPAIGLRQQEVEQQAREMQHLQQEVARLRQERDDARMLSNSAASSSSKQALNRKLTGATAAVSEPWLDHVPDLTADWLKMDVAVMLMDAPWGGNIAASVYP